MFTTDEKIETIMIRSRGLGIPLEPHLKNKMIDVQRLDPSELSPGEFITRIRTDVEEKECRVVIIDSLNGLLTAMQERLLSAFPPVPEIVWIVLPLPINLSLPIPCCVPCQPPFARRAPRRSH